MGRDVVGVEVGGSRAIVRSRRELRYAVGADPSLDRPAHVRAGSALAVFGDRLAVIQDDASFVALVDVRTGLADAIALPSDHGVRLFSDSRGNKHRKMDLEACFVDDGALWAFGSGSSPARERIVRVRGDDVDVFDGAALYARLRRVDFAGSELNVEGAVLVQGRLWLFQRGNGAPRDGVEPIDAIGELDWAAVRDWLEGRGEVPELLEVRRVSLGAIDGVRLTFTDAALVGEQVMFLAAAEASPDAVRDGPVVGVALGWLSGGEARWVRLSDAEGRPVLDKAEGLAELDGRLWIVVDRDDPEVASVLCEVELDLGARAAGDPGTPVGWRQYPGV